MSWPWSQLGLSGPSDLPEIRRAYAEKLKTTHPEDDPEGFQRLHSAYQLASRMARQQRRRAGEQPPEERSAPPPPPEAPTPPPEEEDFDFDQLLQEDEEPSRPQPEEEQDFDFERLIAEGEAERAEARRRRGEERRRAQAQVQAWARERQKAQEWTQKREQWRLREEQGTHDRERQDQFRQEETRWQSTETILHTIEMMYNARAGAEAWEKFFQSPLFQQAKGGLDLIFGLEDFVSTRNLSQEARLALFLAYGFDKGVARPELRPLYQMLLPAWREHNQEKNHERFLAVLGLVLGVAAPFVLVPLLDLGLVPALFISLSLVWALWVVRKALKTGNLERRARGQRMSKKQERRSVILGTLCVVALLAAVAWMRSGPSLDKLLPTKDPREQTCRYIEQDLGVEVGSIYNRNAQYATAENGNLFYLEPDTAKVFLAGPDGERDTKAGKPGYTTNLPEMMVLWALKDFAKARGLPSVNGLDQMLGRGETKGVFLITLPFYGAGETITELGVLLEELSQEQWYQAQIPKCEIVLCGSQMKEGRLILTRYQPTDGAFDAQGVRALYEEDFAHAYCAQLLKELELDRDFLRDEGELYTLTGGGMAEMKGEECCKLYGLDQDGQVGHEYYVNTKGTAIYCVPRDFWETGGSEEQISFYRVLHWNDADKNPLRLINLFYPWLMPSD